MTETVLVIVLFVVLGIVFSTGKGSFLIAGFNFLPKEEKEKYDSVSLCKFMGKIMFAFTFSIVIWRLSEAYEIMWLFFLNIILILSIVVFTLISIMGSRFKK